MPRAEPAVHPSFCAILKDFWQVENITEIRESRLFSWHSHFASDKKEVGKPTTDFLARHSRSHEEKPFSHGSDTERHGREADLGTLFSLLPFSV